MKNSRSSAARSVVGTAPPPGLRRRSWWAEAASRCSSHAFSKWPGRPSNSAASSPVKLLKTEGQVMTLAQKSMAYQSHWAKVLGRVRSIMVAWGGGI